MLKNPIPHHLNLRLVADGLDHPEAVCWSPFENTLFAGSEHEHVYAFPLRGGPPRVFASVAGAFILGMALDGQSNLYACDYGNHLIQRINRKGEAKPYGSSIAFPNYPVFDESGVLWVSNSGETESPTGQIVGILRNGDNVPLECSRPFKFANGLAIRHGYLYVAESFLPGVSRVPLEGGDVEVVIKLPQAVPDGLAFDAEGGLWISLYQPNRVIRLGPDGTTESILDDWSGQFVFTPSNLAFAGPQLETLVIASLGGDRVMSIEAGIRGAPLEYPNLSS